MRIFQNLNPKYPQESFNLHVKFLYFLGLWPPQLDDRNEITRKNHVIGWTNRPNYWKSKLKYWIYQVYSFLFRFGFLYFYTFTQVMFFRNVSSVKDVADALFLLLTQFSLIYKVNVFDQNQIKIRKFVEFLESSTCLAEVQEEEKRKDRFGDNNEMDALELGGATLWNWLKISRHKYFGRFITTAMKRTILSFLSFFVPAQITILTWGIFPLIDEAEVHLPLPAWYPFDISSNWAFGIIYVYQIYGIYVSSWYNVSIETFLSGLLAHGTAQVDRLGYKLSKLGYNKHRPVRRTSRSTINVYKELKQLIIFHKTIINFIEEIEEIFHKAIFAQLVASVIIVCMTGLQLIGTPVNTVKFLSMALYLSTMIVEIASFCWMGNELIYSSTHLTENAYFSNFTEFDIESKKMLIFFMIRAQHKEMCFKAGNLLKVTLSLPTLLNIIKTSYSYFAVLQTIQSQE